MKVIIAGIILICFFFFSSHSQVNTYFQNNPVWQDGTSCAFSYPCIKNETVVYSVNGDTIINSLTYKKIFKKSQGYFYDFNGQGAGCTGAFFSVDSVASYFLRSFDRKMFLYLPGDTAEFLLYDFNLEVGDTLPASNYLYSSGITVTAIDSVYTPYGYLKRFSLSGNSAAQYLIEGVGSSQGLFAPLSIMLECGYTQNCFSLNDTAYYPQTGPTCDLNVGVPSFTGSKKQLFFPNPFTSETEFVSDIFLQNATLKIYNAFGQLMRQTNNISGKSVHLSGQDLPGGLYFIRLFQNNILLGADKIILAR